jgi:hypothetical protein
MKGNDVLAKCSRFERRRLLAAEEKNRKNGTWGQWESFDLPNGTGSDGWSGDCRRAYKCNVFSVLERKLPDGVIHLSISSLSGIRPTWWEMQRIKNDIAGTNATAVEVYPPQNEVVDGADMFHIWVLPYKFTFTIMETP